MPKQRKKRDSFFNSRGDANPTLFLIGAIILGLVLSGLFYKFPKTAQTPDTTSTTESAGVCCDTGDKEKCTTVPNKTVTYNDPEKGSQEYGLLKSNVNLTESVLHLKNSGQTSPDGHPIIISTADAYNKVFHAGTKCGQEAVWNGDSDCTPIPKGELIYICKENCSEYAGDPKTSKTFGEAGTGKLADLTKICNAEGMGYATRDGKPERVNGNYLTVYCYGNPKTIYDVYFRKSDEQTSGIPDFIKNCSAASSITPTTAAQKPKQEIVVPTQIPDKPNLQLGWFWIKTATQAAGTSSWVSPFCKPAIYLYPEKKTDATVVVKPQGKMTLTIPQYPQEGWNVTAYPDGQITYQNASYNYLYYEAELPDEKIQKPQTGFVVEYNTIKTFLPGLLGKLGLNNSEKDEFTQYWAHVLPNSPYYFIGIIPQKELDSLSPILVQPQPQTTIRVTLYFQALDTKVTVAEPTIQTPQRRGFTVVEWGGIFKRDTKHPFSCFM